MSNSGSARDHDTKQYLTASRVDELRAVLLRQQRLVTAALAGASLLVPVFETVSGEGTRSEERTVYGVFTTLGFFLGVDADDFGGGEGHSRALDAGLVLGRCGIVLLVIGILAALVLAVAGAGSHHRGPLALGVTAAVVVLGVAAVSLGLSWLSDDELSGAAWGVLVPIVLAAWTLLHAHSSARLAD